jgi:hypothetical protein
MLAMHGEKDTMSSKELDFKNFHGVHTVSLRRWPHCQRHGKVSIVRLTAEERATLRGVIKKLQGSSEQVRRAHMLLKADANGPNWTDTKIAEAFSCRTKTVENVRQRLVTVGFVRALHREKPQTPPRQKQLDGEQEAQVIALRLGQPPKGFANWSLRLLAEQVVELAIVDAISHETLRKMLKKTA